jgi:hypothetical protein
MTMANWDTAGNAAAAADFLGTTNGQPLVVKTAGTEHMRVLPAGNIGIGTATPAVKVHVTGNRMRLESGGRKLDLRADGSAVDVQSDTSTLYVHSLGPAGNNHVVINPFPQSGNVGVGTNVPAVKMHIVGNRLRLESGGRRLDLRADGSAVDVHSETSSLYLHSTGPAGRNHVFLNPFSQSGNVGIGTQAPADKLHVAGNVRANDFIVTSDLCLKEHVQPLQGALDKLRRMRGVAFSWKDSSGEQSEPPTRRARAGMIAQEIETVAPELVHREGESGLRGVNVTGMLATLIEALKELATENDVLDRRLRKLEAGAAIASGGGA